MDELIGKMAMVHPDLTNDFYRNQGKIGMISSVRPHLGEATLNIGGVDIDYPLEALLTLRPLHMIKKYAIRSNQYLSKQDLAYIQYVHDLISTGREKNLVEAFTTSVESFPLRSIILTSIRDWVSRGFNDDPDLHIPQSRRR